MGETAADLPPVSQGAAFRDTAGLGADAGTAAGALALCAAHGTAPYCAMDAWEPSLHSRG
ncbi:hypothetical protein ADK52_23170 [Streptomyces sp. WM6372]|nr:hypothetical protein ADK52_23170 [Streptomyces sp. WM6372]